MTSTFRQRGLVALLSLMTLLSLLIGSAPTSVAAASAAGTVYTLTNMPAAAVGNNIAIFARAWNGTLTAMGSVATGGVGTGAGLGSQGALALSADRRHLFAVNAGSNDISAFAVAANGALTLTDRVSSGGETPVSLTHFGNLLYVLNAGGSGNITGFTVNAQGKLSPLPSSTRPLSGPGAGAAQVQFSPNGKLLAVTEKATNQILTYVVAGNGLTTGPTVTPSAGTTPYGFGFSRQNRLFISEASARAVSSYNVAANGNVSVVSGSVATDQAAPCWVAVTENGRFVYTTNAGSASITGYQVLADGRLVRLDPTTPTATTGAQPLDMAVSRYSNYLYVLQGGAHHVSGFEILNDGHLVPINSAGTLPVGTVGLAAI